MESQMVRPQGYAHEQDPYQAHDPHSVEGGEEQREKKSVLKKVKAKAKKIKNSIIPKNGNGKSHGDDDHDRNIPDDHDLDEEDDEEDYEESSEGPEVHGAPIYESEKAVMSSARGEDRPLSSLSDHGISDSPKESKAFVPAGLEEDPHAPATHHQNPSNYQTKVADPSGNGAAEVGTNPILSSFGKMNIDEDSSQPKSNQSVDSPPTPASTPTSGYVSSATSALANRAVSAKNMVASKLGYGEKDSTAPETTAATGESKPATSALTDRAISAKNMVASKLGYGEKDNTTPEAAINTATTDENKPASATATEYGKKIASTVYGTVAGAGTAVMSKIPRGGGGAAPGSESPVAETAAKAEDKGVSVKEYLAEKLRPGEDDTALSDAIADAIHKRQPEEAPRTAAPELGKVTQSEEVTRRLGDDGESEMRIEGKGSGYVDKVKGTVTSWLGYGDQSSKGSPKSPGEKVDDGLEGKDELKLQESSKY